MTSGDIHRMFKQEDEGTIIRRNNVRRIALENGIKNTLTQNIILIDSKDFFEKVNPYNLEVHEYSIPKLRCIEDCAREWNNNRKTGDRFIHADEIRDFLKMDTTVFKLQITFRIFVGNDFIRIVFRFFLIKRPEGVFDVNRHRVFRSQNVSAGRVHNVLAVYGCIKRLKFAFKTVCEICANADSHYNNHYDEYVG